MPARRSFDGRKGGRTARMEGDAARSRVACDVNCPAASDFSRRVARDFHADAHFDDYRIRPNHDCFLLIGAREMASSQHSFQPWLTHRENLHPAHAENSRPRDAGDWRRPIPPRRGWGARQSLECRLRRGARPSSRRQGPARARACREGPFPNDALPQCRSHCPR